MINEDNKQLQHDHKNTYTNRQRKHSTTNTLTFPVALLIDDTHDDDKEAKDEVATSPCRGTTPSLPPSSPHFH